MKKSFLYLAGCFLCLFVFSVVAVSELQAACSDVDGDGFGNPPSSDCTGGGLTDCDDNDPNRYPGAVEVCDGVDNDCDGRLPFDERDTDRDGVPLCGGDCNDYDPTRFPGNVEICGDRRDNDCDGLIDDASCICPDGDGDGFNLASCGGTDCDDTDATVSPGATEVCNDGKDNTCNGLTDCADPSCATAPECLVCVAGDTDQDGYSTAGGTCGPIDCDDGDSQVYPGASEICDGKDSNCDGYTPTNEVDADGDGVFLCANDCDDNDPLRFPGNPEVCDGIDNDCAGGLPFDERDNDHDGVSLCAGDCNDFDAARFPGNPEICGDNKDNDCDGVVDGPSCGCPDADGDGFNLSSCGGTDCNDNNPNVYPGAPENCSDGIDNNCDGLTDCMDGSCSADPACAACAAGDLDGDGYSTAGGNCGLLDCDDTDANVFPGASEICDGKDSNCDGFKPASEADADHDGVPLCAGDCNDNDPTINPNVMENCSDGIDNDCDSRVDAADSDCLVPQCGTRTTPRDAPHLAPLLNPDGTIHPDETSLRCGKCHNPNDFLDNTRYQCQRCHADPNDPSDPLNGVTKALYPDPFPYGFGSAPNVVTHSAATVGNKYGNWGVGCVNCHNPHSQEQNNKFGTSYGKLVKELLCYDNQVTGEHVESLIEFTAGTGAGSFADGPPHDANICEACHTRTNHHQNDGTAPKGQSHHDGEKCTDCHLHSGGFAPIGGSPEPPHNTDFYTANCDLCHQTDANGKPIFATPIPSTECIKCHGTRRPHASSVSTTGKYTYSTECVDCHNPMFKEGSNIKAVRQTVAQSAVPGSVVTFTVETGAGSFADGSPFNENICDTCHTQTNHHRADGMAPGDLDGTGTYIGHYDGSDCTLCHDHNNSWIAP